MTSGFASPTLRGVRQEGSSAALQPDDLEWPWWLPLGSTLGALFVGIEALRHRVDEFGADVLWVAAPLAAVAVAPFVIDLLGHFADRFLVPRLPWAALTIGAVVALLVDSPTSTDFAPFLLVMVCIQGPSTASTRQGLVMLVASCGSLLGLEASGQFNGTGIWVVGCMAGFAGGLAVRKSVEAVTQERVAQASRVEKATLNERQRIAREIHDVIAHSLSVTLLHLTGARRTLETDGDTGEAVDALRDAERLGRQAMNDIRRTVGLLQPEAAGQTEPMPGVGEIPELCEQFAGAGVDVACDIRGSGDGVSLAVGLGLYRIAQESLANVVKHAPGAPVEVLVDADADRVRLVVRNGRANGRTPVTGAPDVGGLGVKGIEERTRLLGGTCRVGPDGDGWIVEVSAPRAPEGA